MPAFFRCPTPCGKVYSLDIASCPKCGTSSKVASIQIKIREGGRGTPSHSRTFPPGTAKRIIRDAEEAMKQEIRGLLHQGGDPASLRQNLTLGEIWRRWHAAATIPGTKIRRSLKDYEARWRDHIEPELGRSPLTALTTERMQDFFRRLALKKAQRGDKTLSQGTRRHILLIINQLLSYAFKEKLYPVAAEFRPTRDIIIPPNPDGKGIALEPEQCRMLWNLMDGHEYRSSRFSENLPAARAALKFAILTGRRKGEIANLLSSEIVKDKLVLPGSKTKNGRPLTVPLSSTALNIARAAMKNGHALVFAGPKGQNVYDMMEGFWRSLKRTHADTEGLEWLSRIRIHDLRHTFSTFQDTELGELDSMILTGHRSRKAHGGYHHGADSRLRQGVDALEKVVLGGKKKIRKE